jgi:hypothetical protein
MTYTWEVTGIKTSDIGDLQNAVIQTYWTKKGTDENGRMGSFDGATPIDLETLDTQNFIQYDQLTEEIVLGWIQSYIDETYERHINEQIQKQIDDLAIKQPPLPWAL